MKKKKNQRYRTKKQTMKKNILRERKKHNYRHHSKSKRENKCKRRTYGDQHFEVMAREKNTKAQGA